MNLLIGRVKKGGGFIPSSAFFFSLKRLKAEEVRGCKMSFEETPDEELTKRHRKMMGIDL
mgnify:CR=1 FL=1|jgi:hypothetical protein